MVGSIGVAISCNISDYQKDIASSKASKKRLDVGTGKEVAVIRERLDDLHLLLVQYISVGRGIFVDAVNNKFG